jgi:hypothetical protein
MSQPAADHPLLTPHFQLANADLPGDRLFWETVLHQSDLFSFKTAQIDENGIPKGGPFGAQLWLYHPDEAPVLVGTEQNPEDSNAVVSKGLASAHAEAENLSPENRKKVIDFLEKDRRQGWKVVQISSGESCPACRSKQVLFALELEKKGLSQRGNFHVAFKATYDGTKRTAGFNDAPYDTTFRAIHLLGQQGRLNHISSLGGAIAGDDNLRGMLVSNDLIHVPVHFGFLNENAPAELRTFFDGVGSNSAAAVVTQQGDRILSMAVDQRGQHGIYSFEHMSVVQAIHGASQTLRGDDVFDSWDLRRGVLITTTRDIGPLAMAEALWSNLSGVVILPSTGVRDHENEFPSLGNQALFNMVAAPYNSENSPIRVTYLGDSRTSISHLLWAAQQDREGLLRKQAKRMQQLGSGVQFRYIDGPEVPLSNFIQVIDHTTNYDGAQGGHEPEALPHFITLTLSP